MLEANFISGYETVTVQGLTQWDKGQQLQITGLATLPVTFQVHFANTAMVEAIVMLGSAVAGVGTVDIPNSLLESELDFKAWIYVIDAEGSETVKTILFSVAKRTKPADFISEPNPTEQSLLEQTLSGVNAATASMQTQINNTNAQVALKANQIDLNATNTVVAQKAYQVDLNATNAQVELKANKSEVTNVMTPKGTLPYASLPTTGNTIGWYYYCTDGDGTHGKGNYVWNGTAWYFGGTGDEGYSRLKETLSNLEDELGIENLLGGVTFTQGSITIGTGVESDSIYRVRSDFIDISNRKSEVFKLKLNKNYMLAVSFVCDENKGYLSGTSFYNVVEGDYRIHTIVPNVTNATYLRFTVRREPDAATNVSEVPNMNMRLINEYTQKIATLKVASWNLGHYYYGGSTAGIPGAEVSQKTPIWRKTISDLECDIFGCQETYEHIDVENTTNAYDTVWKNNYPYSKGNAWSTEATFGLTFFSKYAMSNCEIIDLTDTAGTDTQDFYDRHILHSTVKVEGKDIHLYCCHLHNGETQSDVSARAVQAQEIINEVTGKEYFILFGDFNAWGADEYTIYKNGGFNLANCAWYGTMPTYPSNNTASVPMDNVITSNNIRISNVVNKLTNYATSDHAPLVCELDIY